MSVRERERVGLLHTTPKHGLVIVMVKGKLSVVLVLDDSVDLRQNVLAPQRELGHPRGRHHRKYLNLKASKTDVLSVQSPPIHRAKTDRQSE